MPEAVKRLFLSKDDHKVWGVCGGIGEYLKVDSTVVRIAWIVVTIITGVAPGIIAYIVTAIVVPKNPN
jgi:phage shock protein C